MSDDRPRVAPKTPRTSDVARPRTLLLSALGAAVGVAAAVVAQGAPVVTLRPIARPHADVGCTSCHGESTSAPPPVSGCTSCHGTTHGTTRAGHRALVAKGELGCATCHPQHAGAQGVTFEGDRVIRWGAGAESVAPPPPPSGLARGAIPDRTTVPFVGIDACIRCHDPSRVADPISACVSGASARISQCFDEHARFDEVRPRGRADCAGQHGANRFIAWEAAREVATTTPWVARRTPEGAPWIPVTGALVGALVLGAASTVADRRKRRAEAPKAAPIAPSARKRLPTIDASTCIGCYACVDACPFDVLAVESYVAVVARPEECCGVVLCEQVCPNGSLVITDGELVEDRPATIDLESRDVPGLFIAGDLSGLPLIKNAINQGTHAIDRIADSLPRRRTEALDVIVIGAGPAGLSAALRAKERGLTCVVLEQATIASSIKSFPRDKIVHDPPLTLPVEGALWLQRATKEELLAQWTRIVRARALDVREGQRVVDLVRDGAGFVVRSSHAGGKAELRAARVVLAIGRRGTPRTLDLAVEPGTEERIAYALADARSFEGKNVVVVGLGDSAMEAAIALARQPGTTVTVSYRGARFARGKARTIAELEALIAQKRVKLLLETVPVAIDAAGVTFAWTGREGRHRVPADAMLVLIGGVPSWDLMTRAGIHRPRKVADLAGVGHSTSGSNPSAP